MTSQEGRSRLFMLLAAMAAMASVIVLSNVLVQYPVAGTLGPLVLADLLTWGAFTFPLAFLVTDFANRTLGAKQARRVVIVGFAVAVVLSIIFATPRIAVASGLAFLTAQMLDVQLFDRLARGQRSIAWWTPPAASSVVGSLIDTSLFFTLAFAAGLTALVGYGDEFAVQSAPVLGFVPIDAPRWVSWALGDLAIKLLAIPLLLVPYRLLILAAGLDGPRAQAA